jgi:hypothetical protein
MLCFFWCRVQGAAMTSRFAGLPAVLLHSIFLNFDVSELLSKPLSAVCASFREACKSEDFLKALYWRDVGASLRNRLLCWDQTYIARLLHVQSLLSTCETAHEQARTAAIRGLPGRLRLLAHLHGRRILTDPLTQLGNAATHIW